MSGWTQTTDQLPEAGIPVRFELLVNRSELTLEMLGSFDGDYFVVCDDGKKPPPKFAPALVARWRRTTPRTEGSGTDSAPD